MSHNMNAHASTLTRFGEYVQRATRTWGAKFSDHALLARFVPYFNSRERVRVRFTYESGHVEELTGTIGVTTGWQPVFLLMRTSRSRGSSITLNANARVVAVKHCRRYIPVAE